MSGETCFLVGLGNPGRRYASTRHNVGFRVIERLWNSHAEGTPRRRFRVEYLQGYHDSRRVYMARPLAYMNLSGPPIRDFLGYFGGSVEDLLVIHDDLDLPLGTVRFRQRGSSGGHQGIASIIEAMARSDFVRLKIGIDRPGETGDEVVDFVLNAPSGEDATTLSDCERTAADAAWLWVTEGTEQCMNRVNRRTRTGAQEGEN